VTLLAAGCAASGSAAPQGFSAGSMQHTIRFGAGWTGRTGSTFQTVCDLRRRSW
jgi:hypothetical protein